MKINVWNRQYEYENSFFPKSIKIGGEEILYKPISLDVCFGDKQGEWVKQQERKGIFRERSRGHVCREAGFEVLLPFPQRRRQAQEALYRNIHTYWSSYRLR